MLRETEHWGWGKYMLSGDDAIGLVDGEAIVMGGGVVTVLQRDADNGSVNSVVLRLADLKALLAAL